MSIKMAIKEGFSETRHSNYYGESKKSNEVTSFEVILRRNRFSNAFSGLHLASAGHGAIVLANPAVFLLIVGFLSENYRLLRNVESG
ncbi:hypothetical protein [Saccharicrinis fermentans]|uniref:Uncharacterized protein n=1 Tax=Saccharicrinis fermentans DSM 9555 = JCM 21142 TaxID=869213 RepID=W7Y4U2_9BACT|nr:hypothetical protein [Saccharicrinis fermentans]GAF05955.1 hypothetical protein JCM21142_134720 [Saccharicrinis fermentans DSM 9555 = JCM 21142]